MGCSLLHLLEKHEESLQEKTRSEILGDGKKTKEDAIKDKKRKLKENVDNDMFVDNDIYSTTGIEMIKQSIQSFENEEHSIFLKERCHKAFQIIADSANNLLKGIEEKYPDHQKNMEKGFVKTNRQMLLSWAMNDDLDTKNKIIVDKINKKLTETFAI